jgi:hypothetical protein
MQGTGLDRAPVLDRGNGADDPKGRMSMKIENNGFACGVHVVDANGLARYVAAQWNNETSEERATDPMQAVPMLGGLIYEAVMERNSMRALNDALRQTFTGGRVVVSPGVLSLPPQANAEVLERVRGFSAFDAENAPHHDFGRFEFAGVTYCFEVDYARETNVSNDAIDTKATRVLTIMRADEY